MLSGQKIIDRGEIVDEQTYNILKSRKEWEKRSDSVQEKRLTLAGQILYVGIFLFCFMAYLELFRRSMLTERNTHPAICADRVLPRPVFHYGGTELVKYLRGSICHDSDYSPCFP